MSSQIANRSGRLIFRGCATLLLGALILLSSTPRAEAASVCGPASQPSSSPRGKIAVVLRQTADAPGEICLMNPDGKGIQDMGAGSGPAVSPDGKRLAFDSKRDDHFSIYVINSDGSDLRRLTGAEFEAFSPRWSPDGGKILFTAAIGAQYQSQEIYVMNADGSNQRRLTNNTFEDDSPVWSPDGGQIAFVSQRDAPPNPKSKYTEVYVMSADGSNQRRLTRSWLGNFSGYAELPAWSPDGKQIGFLSARENTAYLSLYLMNADGSNLTRLLDLKDYVGPPVWSPDSKRIAFYAGPVGQPTAIYVVNADGTNMLRLLEGRFPTWSPDGKQLTFVHLGNYNEQNDQGVIEIMVMNPDGSSPQRIAQMGTGSVFSYAVWGR